MAYATLQEKIEETLSKQMSLSSENINVDVHDGQVTLSGIVDVLAEKVFAEEVVKGIDGVQAIDNSITIAMDRGINDKDITELVGERLDKERFDLSNISVETIDGLVTLRGQVDSIGEAMQVVKVAQSVRGAKQVVSELGLLSQSSRDDATITNNIELALSRSDQVDVRDVVTSTKHGEVYLEGWVDTQEEIEAAVALASAAKGVKKVHNRLVSSQDATQGDVYVTKQIRQLFGSHGLSAVKIWVTGGIVFMAGEVQTIDQKLKAQELARKIKGLTGIHNSIVVTVH